MSIYMLNMPCRRLNAMLAHAPSPTPMPKPMQCHTEPCPSPSILIISYQSFITPLKTPISLPQNV